MVGKLLSLLRNISEVIAGVDDNAQVLSRIVKILACSLEVDVCSVYEYDPERDLLVLRATEGLNREVANTIQMASGEGLTGSCFASRKIINVSEPQQQAGYKFFAGSGEEKYHSFLAVPLRTGGVCVGVLTIQRVSKEKFPAEVVDTARSLSPQLANLVFSAGILKNLAKENETSTLQIIGGERNLVLPGAAVNSGVAKGKAFRIKPRDLFNEIDHDTHENTEAELELFERALTRARTNTLELETKALSMISEADASIFNSHLIFLEDKMILDAIAREIKEEHHTLEFSLAMVYRRFAKRFKQLTDSAIRERLIDFKDVMLRLLEAVRFLRNEQSGNLNIDVHSSSWVVVARELLPSDLMRLPIDNIAGIVCEKGGATSHVAILSKAFSIPAMLGVQGVLNKVADFDEVLVDCHSEKVYINPDKSVCDKYQHLINLSPQLDEIKPYSPTYTVDKERVYLRANISLICETGLIETYAAEGIGLYRTEFLFMIRDYIPSEEAQYEVFSKVIESGGDEVTLRLLDAGGDKKINSLNLPTEDNPALGLRGVRLLLHNKKLLRAHLRAVLRAGAGCKLKILLPMVSNVPELKRLLLELDKVKCQLVEENVVHCQNYSLGLMLEVPSSIFGLRKMLQYVDFVSFGTNDLMQFAFATDRGHNENQVVKDSLDPVFLGILNDATAVVRKFPEKKVTICGEMASNPLAIPLLVGMGIRSFSMPPKKIPAMRELFSSLDTAVCSKLLKSCLTCECADQVIALVNEFCHEHDLESILKS